MVTQLQHPGPIHFYNKDDPYYQFTNFFPAPILLDGKLWPTTEHYFQAQKFVGTPFTEVIRNFEHPRQAFDLSRNSVVSQWLRKDWDGIKIDVMCKALLAKFTQHKDLRDLLLSTRDNMLIEHTPYDNFWGDGGDGTGQNNLGMLLMEIRHDLRESRNIGTNVKTVKPHSSQKVCDESDKENSNSSQSSSRSLEFLGTEAEKDGHDQHHTLEQTPLEENHCDLKKSPPSGSTTHKGMETADVNLTSVDKHLIDFTETEPEKSETDNLLMADNMHGIEPPIEPMLLDNSSQGIADATVKESPMPGGEQENMDTATNIESESITRAAQSAHPPASPEENATSEMDQTVEDNAMES